MFVKIGDVVDLINDIAAKSNGLQAAVLRFPDRVNPA